MPDIKLCNDSKNEVGRGYSVLLNRVATRCPPYHDGRDDPAAPVDDRHFLMAGKVVVNYFMVMERLF